MGLKHLTVNDINGPGGVIPFAGAIDDIYLEDTEWTTTALVANFDFASANNPRTGSVSVETNVGGMGASNYLSFDKGSLYTGGFGNSLSLWFNTKVAMDVAASKLTLQWYKIGVAVGDPVDLFGGPGVTYGLEGSVGNVGTYQEGIIPFSAFAMFDDVDELRIESGVGPSVREFYLDDVTITGGFTGRRVDTVAWADDLDNFISKTLTQTYVSQSSFEFKGKLEVGNPSKITIVGNSNDGDPALSIRIYDITNAQVIAEITAFTNQIRSIINMGAVANVPPAGAIWEIQTKKDVILGNVSFELSSLTIEY